MVLLFGFPEPPLQRRSAARVTRNYEGLRIEVSTSNNGTKRTEIRWLPPRGSESPGLCAFEEAGKWVQGRSGYYE